MSSTPARLRSQPKVTVRFCVLKLDRLLSSFNAVSKSLLLFAWFGRVGAEIVVVLGESPRKVVVAGVVGLGLPEGYHRLAHLNQIRPPRIKLVCLSDRLGRWPRRRLF